MKKYILLTLALVGLMVACSKDDMTSDIITPTPNEEVKFSLTLDNGKNDTRTHYGEEQFDEDENNDIVRQYFPVFWNEGDLVSIYATAGAESRNQAVYEVITSTGQQSAEDLAHTGAHGVQWGNEGVSDFCAVYPETGKAFRKSGDAILVPASISRQQQIVFNYRQVDENGMATDDIDVHKGTIISSNAAELEEDLPNAIMYARTNGVQNGDVVNLRFKPFSTVLKFHFGGFSSITNANTGTEQIAISSIVLTAPAGVNIAGDFDLSITGSTQVDDKGNSTAAATVKNVTNGSNTITIGTMYPNGSALILKQNEALEFDVFCIPQDMTIGQNQWTVTVNTGSHGSHTFKMNPANGDITLQAGKIHKLPIPKRESKVEIQEFEYDKWISQLDQDIYLSEISFPGSWYALDPKYQATTDLTAQFNQGVRAFNLDCRINKSGSANDHSLLGGIGAENTWSDGDYPSKAYLACAGQEDNTGLSIPLVGSAQGLTESVHVLSAMTQIASLAQTHPNEVLVVVFTFSEKAYDISGYAYGSIRPDFITEQLNSVLNTSGIKECIYTNVSEDTTIDDVISSGKNIIVKINHSVDDFYSNTSIKNLLPAGIMTTFGSLAANSDYNLANDLITNIIGLHSETKYTTYFSQMNEATIYNGTTPTNIKYYYHHGQHTRDDDSETITAGEYPTMGNRKVAIDDVLAKALEIYDNSTHDAWFQIGIGGSLGGDNPAGMSPLVNYLQEKIEDKMINNPSPVGIVLMNHATTTGLQLVKDIVQMNDKFYLKRKGGDIITGGENGTTPDNGGGSGNGGRD
ncbi:MAG: hypothetical protein IKY82_08455 [Alistipes sp.]|nr:hypothetical protein [Alistipes sp.]